jgi:hypothetical protein
MRTLGARAFMKTHARHVLGTLCLALLASTAAAGSPWESVADPVSEQVASVVEWSTQANKSAKLAGAEAKKVEEMAKNAYGSLGQVMDNEGRAKAAMERTLKLEKHVHHLRDGLWKRAQETAELEVPKMLKEIREAADKKAEAAAKKKAIVFGKAMKVKAKTESAKAAKLYMDVMTGAGKTAAEYAKIGDTLVGQSATLQMNAGLAQGSANQYIYIGDMAEAQKLMQQSRSDMNLALSLNGAASGAYNNANKITGQLGVYAGQAAQAAYHAQTMYDPDAVAPPPSLVLAQQRQQHHAKDGAMNSTAPKDSPLNPRNPRPQRIHR